MPSFPAIVTSILMATTDSNLDKNSVGLLDAAPSQEILQNICFVRKPLKKGLRVGEVFSAFFL